MKFSRLLDLPFDHAGNISIPALQEATPCTPSQVLEHVYSAHGRNPEFQKQYEHLNLNLISWMLEELSAAELAGSSTHPDFDRWVEAVVTRLNEFQQRSWICIDNHAPVGESWRNNGT